MASFSSLSTGLSTGGILGMRGLNVFIQDIRNAPSKEHEQKRVDKELANIRTKFKAGSKLTDYDRKKYCWKLLYICTCIPFFATCLVRSPRTPTGVFSRVN